MIKAYQLGDTPYSYLVSDISSETYKIKEQIKLEYGWWDTENKRWIIPTYNIKNIPEISIGEG